MPDADELARRATDIARRVANEQHRQWYGMANRDAYVGMVMTQAAVVAVQTALAEVIPPIAAHQRDKSGATALRALARQLDPPLCASCADTADQRADELERGADHG